MQMEERNGQVVSRINNKLLVLQKFKMALRLVTFPCACVAYICEYARTYMCADVQGKEVEALT